jgi:hypothetical protein
VAPDSWPVEWALLYPCLRDAPIRESSRRRYVDSVNQLAAILPEDVDPEETVMDHRPKRNRQQPADEAAPAGRLLPQIIADIERRSEEQARDIADLRMLVETTVAEKEKIAARLGEAEHELAEALAALEIERQKRQQAEAWTARLEQANRIARAALDLSKVEPDGPEAAAQVDTAPPQDDAPAANEDALALLSDEDREELSLMAADAGLSRHAMVALLCQRALVERRDRLTSRQQAGGTPAVDVAGMSP